MIDFILSKLGILIFAISMASILLFFSLSVKDVFLADETVQISNIIAKQIKYMSESDTLCASKRVLLPKYIDIFGVSDTATFTPIYYGIKITTQESNNSRFIIFDVYNRSTKKSIAIESFKTNAELVFYNESSTNTIKEIDINPTETRVLYMVKNSYSKNNEQKTKIYFVPCDYDPLFGESGFNDCYEKLTDLTKSLNTSGTQGEKFYCVPLIIGE